MTMDNTRTALILIDFVNEIVAEEGKLAGKGYAAFVERHETLDRVSDLLKAGRSRGMYIVHVRVGFTSGYPEHPEASPLFGAAKKFGALQFGTWGTEFHTKVVPLKDETVIAKHRVSAFYATPLDLILRSQGIHKVVLVGVATDLAVQSAARDAHDRDYAVTVVADCCAAADDDDHNHALRQLKKIATVTPLDELMPAV